MFNEQNLQELLELFKKITGKFMLTMFPNAMIERYASECGWTIHRVERTISAARQAHARRKQEEWIVVNYQLKINENAHHILRRQAKNGSRNPAADVAAPPVLRAVLWRRRSIFCQNSITSRNY
jgi:hypothetical protein